MSELKNLEPCPFCGCKAEVIESGPSGKENVTHWQARCASVLTGCIGAEIDTWKCTESDAVNGWNTRAEQSLAAHDAEIEEDAIYRLIKKIIREIDWIAPSNFEMIANDMPRKYTKERTDK